MQIERNWGCLDNSDKAKLPDNDGNCDDQKWFKCSSNPYQTWCIHPTTAAVMLSSINGSCSHLVQQSSPAVFGWKKYITEKDQKICLHPDNRCNMVPHPLCRDGEDERQCKAEYQRKKLILDYADFECESPHHNNETNTATVTIYTTACDGITECFRGIDEQNCEVQMPSYYIFSKFDEQNKFLTNLTS